MPHLLLPKDIQEFLLRYIDSIAELEGLLMFHRDPEGEYDPSLVSQRLYIPENVAEDVLAALNKRGFIQNISLGDAQPKYRYSPASDDLRLAVDNLEELYSKYLIPVTNFIHSKPTLAITQFADAFRLRKKD